MYVNSKNRNSQNFEQKPNFRGNFRFLTGLKANKAISNGVSTDQQNKSWIVYLATFPPRQCGIATFTADLTNAIDQIFGPSVKSKIVAMNLTEVSNFPYPDKVISEISQPREEDYVNIANKLNQLKEVKLVNIQHEFGIFGGEYGSHLLLLLKKLQKPIVTTFHTVLPAPDEKMLNIVQAIMKYSKGIIVMTHSSKEILKKDYGLDPDRIQVIPHGIHHVPYRISEHAKSALGFSGKLILSTFGFLSPGKGVEHVIEALPKVAEKFPNVRFLIAGVTHPVVLGQEGETYRNFLTKKVYQLGLSNYVSFYNTYLDLNGLFKFLEATDIYLSTSLNPNQTVSGTLSYALGSGRPVISTAFAQAKQDITSDVGILVDFKNPPAFTDAIIKLISNDQLRLQMGKNAYFRTRHMTWANVAHSYIKYFSQFAPKTILGQKKLPPIKLTHMARLTDNFGIIQFAKLTEPDLSSGYTIDDNARALVAVALHYKKFRTHSALKLVSIYLNFFYLVAKPDGYFDNYVNSSRAIDKQRNIQEYSEDPSARALYALAWVSTTKQIPRRIRHLAHFFFERSFRKSIAFSSPRAIAFYIKALDCLLSKWKESKTLTVLTSYCEQLMALYEKNYSPDWEWFEPCLTYSNAILPEALLLGYKITGEKRYFKVAEKTLNFLIKHTFKGSMYIPIGQSGWFPKEGARHYFDQQPEDTAATVGALNVMFQITNRKYYKELASIAFNWFLGNNVLGQVVYDRTTGGCYDGIGEKFINLNQGAESTISYLLARLSFEN
ncbi:glycosyl transferase family 1 [Candidatus Berkelbacteria bacterium CG_4_10_14_0_8_um_filter_39_42]|uniref:Glycosyl transferase family 1 n=1 Tax=Candidatus Berkelbacteria bacterium CG03_land_8_20_14_0_80_40_36 TaxID=1974509 RepID=A0A2M7CJ41_9BACT|nr:glycosyltransferase [Candidatus Parcubacteria bacterium]PIV25630.1 MAG: glycosyl transferase family 1 [Candidatus Berkelbacteria bacterium CG03_land_8_20_14_0_80_40_36]PIZ29147.1 MAG: glycosyl transferase family 1 [Candidatus Berkelbacteria bacterium CG_4_10_14_0_8_um_filter_39_42]